jgi:hypothetical protein
MIKLEEDEKVKGQEDEDEGICERNHSRLNLNGPFPLVLFN